MAQRWIVGCGAALVVALSMTSIAQAALVDNGLYTTDTSTGLDWLDLTETNGFSFNHVNGQLGSGGTWEGWRHATNFEAVGLFTTLGLPIASGAGAVGQEPEGFMSGLTTFVNLFGDVVGEWSPLTHYGATGITAGLGGVGFHQQLGAYTFASGQLWAVQTSPGGCCVYSDSVAETFYGHFLVRDSAEVPLPAAAWLLLSGLGGLGLVARRRRSPTPA